MIALHVLATMVSLVLRPLGASPDSCGCDSLQVQRAIGSGAYATASAWAGPGPALVALKAPGARAGADSLAFYVSQSTAANTRCTYRVRCSFRGSWSAWSLPLGLVTSAPDTVYTLMSSDGRIAGEWVKSANGVARVPALRWAGMDSTVRCVSQREVQTKWADRIRELFGYVR